MPWLGGYSKDCSIQLSILCASTILSILYYFEMKSLTPQSKEKWVGVILEGQLGNQLWAMASSHGIAKARGARWCWIDTNHNRATFSHRCTKCRVHWVARARPARCLPSAWTESDDFVSWRLPLTSTWMRPLP